MRRFQEVPEGRRVGGTSPPFLVGLLAWTQLGKGPTEVGRALRVKGGHSRGAAGLSAVARSGWWPAPRRTPRPADSPEPARRLGGAAAARSRRAEPGGQLEQVGRGQRARGGDSQAAAAGAGAAHLTRRRVGRGARAATLPLAGRAPRSDGGAGLSGAPGSSPRGSRRRRPQRRNSVPREAGRPPSPQPECAGGLEPLPRGSPEGGAGLGRAAVCLAPLPRARPALALRCPLQE